MARVNLPASLKKARSLFVVQAGKREAHATALILYTSKREAEARAKAREAEERRAMASIQKKGGRLPPFYRPPRVIELDPASVMFTGRIKRA